MSCIHFIGGEKGGVGKSVTARVLAQFHIDRDIPFTAFDSDRSHGAMMRFYGDFTQPVTLESFESADQLVESAVEQDCNVLVDLAAQTSRSLHTWVEQNGLLELAGELGLKLVYWHVMDDGHDSLELLDGLLAAYGEKLDYVLVRNFGRGRDFAAFDASPSRKTAEAVGARIIDLAELHAPTMRKVDHTGNSFWAAANNKDASVGPCLGLMERQRVRVWLRKAYAGIEALPCFVEPPPPGVETGEEDA